MAELPNRVIPTPQEVFKWHVSPTSLEEVEEKWRNVILPQLQRIAEVFKERNTFHGMKFDFKNRNDVDQLMSQLIYNSGRGNLDPRLGRAEAWFKEHAAGIVKDFQHRIGEGDPLERLLFLQEDGITLKREGTPEPAITPQPPSHPSPDVPSRKHDLPAGSPAQLAKMKRENKAEFDRRVAEASPLDLGEAAKPTPKSGRKSGSKTPKLHSTTNINKFSTAFFGKIKQIKPEDYDKLLPLIKTQHNFLSSELGNKEFKNLTVGDFIYMKMVYPPLTTDGQPWAPGSGVPKIISVGVGGDMEQPPPFRPEHLKFFNKLGEAVSKNYTTEDALKFFLLSPEQIFRVGLYLEAVEQKLKKGEDVRSLDPKPFDVLLKNIPIQEIVDIVEMTPQEFRERLREVDSEYALRLDVGDRQEAEAVAKDIVGEIIEQAITEATAEESDVSDESEAQLHIPEQPSNNLITAANFSDYAPFIQKNLDKYAPALVKHATYDPFEQANDLGRRIRLADRSSLVDGTSPDEKLGFWVRKIIAA
jgi:hypothetical protein